MTETYAFDDENGALVPASVVRQRYRVTDVTIWRWQNDLAMGFPRPTVINRRNYWRIGELVAWEKARQETPAITDVPLEPTEREETPDTIVIGLYLITQPTGSRSYAYRCRVNGRSIKYTIGTAADCRRQRTDNSVSLKEARLVAQALNDMIAKFENIAA